MRQASTWATVAGTVKLLTLAIIIAMFAKIGWNLVRGEKVDLTVFTWLLLTLGVSHLIAWAVGRHIGSKGS